MPELTPEFNLLDKVHLVETYYTSKERKNANFFFLERPRYYLRDVIGNPTYYYNILYNSYLYSGAHYSFFHYSIFLFSFLKTKFFFSVLVDSIATVGFRMVMSLVKSRFFLFFFFSRARSSLYIVFV